MTDQTPAPGAAPGAAPEPVPTGAFTPEQLQSMAQHEVDRGRLTRAEADAMLKVDGIEPAAQPSAEQAAYDKDFPRAANIAEYEMPLLRGADPATAATLDRTARTWLFDAGFDRGRGSSLLKEVARVGDQYATMSESERQIYQRTERARLERVHGDKTNEKIKLARQLVRELEAKKPGLMDILEQGPGNSAMVISLLAAQAEILRNRPRGK